MSRKNHFFSQIKRKQTFKFKAVIRTNYLSFEYALCICDYKDKDVSCEDNNILDKSWSKYGFHRYVFNIIEVLIYLLCLLIKIKNFTFEG